MSEAVLILENMRGGCATVGGTVHTLFRFKSHRPRSDVGSDNKTSDTITSQDIADAIASMGLTAKV